MEAVAGPYLIAVILLGIAGVQKIFSPKAALAVISQLGFPERSLLVWCVGASEVAVAVWALAVGGWIVAICVSVSFAGFASITALLIRSGSGLSCGCFGTNDTPPSLLHIIVNLLASLSGGLASVAGVGSVSNIFSNQPWNGILFTVLVAVGVYGLYVIMAELPRLTKSNWSEPKLFSPVQSFEKVTGSP